MIFGCYFTRYKQLEFWEEMENRIHVRQYTECFLPTLVPAVGVSLWISWWFMLIPLSAYHFPAACEGRSIVCFVCVLVHLYSVEE